MNTSRRIWALLLAALFYAPCAFANPSGSPAGALFFSASVVAVVYVLCVRAIAGPIPVVPKHDFLKLMFVAAAVLALLAEAVILVVMAYMAWAGIRLLAGAAALYRATDRPSRRQFWRYSVAGLLMLAGFAVLIGVLRMPYSPGFPTGIANYKARVRAARAIEEIKSAEAALKDVVRDAGVADLSSLYVSGEREGSAGPYVNGVLGYLGYDCGEFTMEQMAKAQALYTDTLYALLRVGRRACGLPAAAPGHQYAEVLDVEVVARLADHYLDLDRGPWGQLYQLWPGPWPAGTLNRFRSYGPADSDSPGSEEEAPSADALTSNTESSREEHRAVRDVYDEIVPSFGYPAPRNLRVFIWSCGQNLVSGQLAYVNEPAPGHCGSGQSNNPARWGYDEQQDSLYFGGGDDINNWDNGRSWEVFYN